MAHNYGTEHVGVRKVDYGLSQGPDWEAFDRETGARIGPSHPTRYDAQRYAEDRQASTYTATPARTDYSTSKYQDAVTEWAYAISLDGLSPTAGDLSEGRDWYALVTLDYETGYATCDPDLIDAASDATYALLDHSRVIIREDEQGFVWCDYGPVHPLGDPGAYRALLAAWADIEARDAGDTDDRSA